MAKKQTYTDKSVEQLMKQLAEKREELRHLRFSAAGSRPKDTNALASIRKEIARILTEVTKKSKVTI